MVPVVKYLLQQSHTQVNVQREPLGPVTNISRSPAALCHDSNTTEIAEAYMVSKFSPFSVVIASPAWIIL